MTSMIMIFGNQEGGVNMFATTFVLMILFWAMFGDSDL